MKITQKSSCYDLENVKGPMMHGHTSIVLKNVKTGLVERVESDNTFQSAILQNYHNDYGCLVAGNNTLFSDLNSHFTFENIGRRRLVVYSCSVMRSQREHSSCQVEI